METSDASNCTAQLEMCLNRWTIVYSGLSIRKKSVNISVANQYLIRASSSGFVSLHSPYTLYQIGNYACLAGRALQYMAPDTGKCTCTDMHALSAHLLLHPCDYDQVF